MPNDNPNGGCAQVIGYMSGLNRYAAIDAMASKSDNPANLRAASNGRARAASCRGEPAHYANSNILKSNGITCSRT